MFSKAGRTNATCAAPPFWGVGPEQGTCSGSTLRNQPEEPQASASAAVSLTGAQRGVVVLVWGPPLSRPQMWRVDPASELDRESGTAMGFHIYPLEATRETVCHKASVLLLSAKSARRRQCAASYSVCVYVRVCVCVCVCACARTSVRANECAREHKGGFKKRLLHWLVCLGGEGVDLVCIRVCGGDGK